MKKWFILLCGLIGTAFAAWEVSKQVPRYTASAQVILNVGDVQDPTGMRNPVRSYLFSTASINTELRSLQSEDLLRRVVQSLELQNHWEFNPSIPPPPQATSASTLEKLFTTVTEPFRDAPPRPSFTPALGSPEAAESAAVSALRGVVSTRNLEGSYVFLISAQTLSPEMAPAIVNAVAQEYVASQRERSFNEIEESIVWLGERVAELKVELETAEGKVADFAADASLLGEEALVAGRLQLKAMRDQEAELWETAERLRKQISSLEELRRNDDFPGIARAATDPELQRLARGLSRDDPAENALPEFDALFAQLIVSLGSQAERLEGRARDLAAAVTELAAQVSAQSSDLITLQQLKREADAARVIYESFLGRLKEMSVRQGTQRSDVSVLTLAHGLGRPIFTNKTRDSLKGGLKGIGLAIILVLALNAIRTSIRSPEELEAVSGHSVISVIPNGPSRHAKAVLEEIVEKPGSRLGEAVRNLRTAIQLSNVDVTPKVVLVTSSVPEEGKSVLAAALAQTTALSGKRVLLVDADLRRRVLSKFFDTTGKQGLVSILSGASSFEDARIIDQRTGLHVVLAEGGKVTPVDLFESDQFARFLSDAREQYDLVVLDTPPVLAVPDARVLAQHADATVYAVRWNKTSRRMVKTGLGSLSQAHVHVSVLALTRVDPKRMDIYGYYGYGTRGYGLGKYYSA
ncbi:polysaccharide biosynthesis tyrosine autokinase [Limibaculum sp. FT325]|nr:polysaccharide biosynthesis tyrosine autokinase [Limibaculum sediminis]